MDYFTECQQKQVYASMLRGDPTIQQSHKCPPYTDVVHQTEVETMLPFAHVDYFARDSMALCPLHSQSVLKSPMMTSKQSNRFIKEGDISSPVESCIQHVQRENVQNTTQSYI